MLVAAVAALAAPFTGVPAAPPVVVDSYRVRADTLGEASEIATVGRAERLRFRTLGAFPSLEVRRAGTTFIAATSDQDGSVLRGTFAAQPEGLQPSGFPRHDLLVSYVVAQARAATIQLTPTTLAGRAALRAEVPLPANECAGFPARTARVWLAQRTLLPLRVVERANSSGRVFRATSYAYSALNAAFPPSTFATPPLGRSPFSLSNRFTRTSPAAAAGPLPYTPRVPAVLPPGFVLATAGWAPRSGLTGAEGSIGAMPWLFAASYRRGQERIDITQRVSTVDWPDDPFGGECQPLRTEAVTVNALPATYGIGQNTTPHVYWRDGALLYTVSGPFPRDDLIAIAASLRKVGV